MDFQHLEDATIRDLLRWVQGRAPHGMGRIWRRAASQGPRVARATTLPWSMLVSTLSIPLLCALARWWFVVQVGWAHF